MAKKRAATEPNPGNGTPVTKADAVRAALAAGKSLPDEGVAYVKAEFGLDISKAMFSSYKTAEKARARKKGGRPRGRRPGAGAPAVARNGKADVVEALATIKKLVDELGVDQVVRIAQVFRA